MASQSAHSYDLLPTQVTEEGEEEILPAVDNPHACQGVVQSSNADRGSGTEAADGTRASPILLQTPGCFGARHGQLVMIMLGYMCAYLQKLVLGIGIVAMADGTAGYSYIPVIELSTSEKSIVSSMYFYGYLVGSIPVTLIANKFRPGRSLAITIGLVCGLISCLTPFLTILLGFKAFCACRLLLGLLQCCLFSFSTAFIGKWVVPLEREKCSWVYCGVGFASLIVSPVGGLLATSPLGWPSIFCFPGILSIVWGFSSLWIFAETPSEHDSISSSEKDYIEFYNNEEASEKARLSRAPWMSLLTSIPVWALIAPVTAQRWVDGVIMYFIPTFLHGVFNTALELNGFLNMLPTLCGLPCAFLFAYIGGVIRPRVGRNFSRKLWLGVAFLGLASCLLICGLFDLGMPATLTVLILGICLCNADYLGTACNFLDLTPNYVGNLWGFVGSISIVGSIFSTTMIGLVVTDESDLSQWQTIFLSCGIIEASAALIFIVFGSTSVQKWNYPPEHHAETEKETPKI